MEVITKSARETQKLGKKLAASLKGKKVIALYGELGSGKTTFVQGLARGLGIKGRIISPTFVFIRSYPLPITHNSKPIFYHVDLYRIDKIEDTRGLGIEELMVEKEAIVVIEWAEKIKSILPKKRIDIFFEYVSEKQRKINISGN